MAKQYIEPQKRYEDHKSTGILFLAIGAAGTLITVLCWMDILKFPLNGFQLGILLAMFVAFMGFGLWSFKRASEVFKTIDSENGLKKTERLSVYQIQPDYPEANFTSREKLIFVMPSKLSSLILKKVYWRFL